MGETALFQAVEMECLSQVETLLKFKADPNIPRKDGLTPLHAAAIKQNTQVVELLLKAGSNPNYESKLFLQTPVHYAIKHSVKPAILMLLVRYNGSLSIRDKNKKRPIDYVETEEIQETLNMLKLEKEDAFKTPQKQLPITFINNTNSYNQHKIAPLGRTYTPIQTADYVFPKMAERSAYDSKEFVYRTVAGNVKKNLFDTICNDNEFTLDENEDTKRTDSENIFIQNQYMNTSNNLNYSQTEYFNTLTKDENNFTIENRFDSFVTKEGAIISKLNSPKTLDDGGISEINPLDTLYSNRNLIDKPNDSSLKKNPEIIGTQGSKREFSHKKKIADTPERAIYPNPHIREKEIEESSGKNDRVSEFQDDSLEANEECFPVNPMQGNLSHADFVDALKNDLCDSRNEKTEVNISYTISEKSYRISEVPSTSKKKKNVDVSVIEGINGHYKTSSDYNTSDNRIISKKLTFNKNYYHVKGNKCKDINSMNNQINDIAEGSTNNLAKSRANNSDKDPNMQINRLKNTIHLNDIHFKTSSSNSITSPQEKKINLSPSYVKRMKFSQQRAISPTYSMQNSFRNNTCGSNCNVQLAIPYKTLVSADEERIGHESYNKNSGVNSTRQTSAQYHTDDQCSHSPRERPNRKANLSETINRGFEFSNSNRTFIHNGDTGTDNTRKLKKISVISNYSRRSSPKSFSRGSPRGDCLDTVYCSNSEISKSNISTTDAKKLHDWLNSIGMLSYYNNFLENGLFPIDEMVKGMEDSNTRISYKLLEEIGIRKPGHIYRMLIKLELDAKFIDESVSQFIFDRTKTNETNSNNMNTNIQSYNLKLSSDKYVCCGLVNEASEMNKHSSKINTKNVANFRYDVITWLKMSKLSHLRKHFLHNGFDSIEFFILQMFSSYPFDDQMIEECLHIYSKKERRTILSHLNKEVVLINNRLMNMTNVDEKSYDSDMSSSFYIEKTKIDDGCKMCTIF